MGMYDVFGSSGDQLKIFLVPYVYKDQMYFMEGNLNYYTSGDPVPFKTLWYNYTENFVVLDTDYNLNQIYYFRDGKFEHITEWDSYNAIPPEVEYEYYEFYSNNPVVIDKSGNFMIVPPDELQSYFRAIRRYIEIVSAKDRPKDWENELRSLNCDKYYVSSNDNDIKYILFGGYVYLLSTEEVSEEFVSRFRELVECMRSSLDDYYKWADATEEEKKLVEDVMNRYIN